MPFMAQTYLQLAPVGAGSGEHASGLEQSSLPPGPQSFEQV
jgi:hypothetical protein